MPNPSIKMSIAPSKLALYGHALLGLAVTALVLMVAGVWFALCVALLLA